MKLRRGGLVGSVGLWMVGAALAQGAAPVERRPPQNDGNQQLPTTTIRVQSRFVNVALNVVDAAGAPVGGLSVGAFELTEDGKPQRIAVFEKESTTPLSIVLALDASESVFSDRGLEREAAKGFLKGLVRPQDRVDLMGFSDSVDEVVSFTNDVRAVDSGIGRIQRGASTALYDAIYLASQRLGQAPAVVGERRVIVLITDGENTTPHGSYDAAIEQAERAGAMIYALIVVPVAADAGRNEGGEHALIQMAHDTGGKYYYVEDKRDLAPAFAHVSEDLRTQYTVGYYAPQRTLNDAGLRQIGLKLKDPALAAKYTLRYRTAYFAKP